MPEEHGEGGAEVYRIENLLLLLGWQRGVERQALDWTHLQKTRKGL